MSNTMHADSAREGLYSNPMAGADRIHDLLPVHARRPRVAHQPVPDLRIGLVEQRVERGKRLRIGLRTDSIEPAAQQSVQLARAAPAAPAQALQCAGVFGFVQCTSPKPSTPQRIQSTIPPARYA